MVSPLAAYKVFKVWRAVKPIKRLRERRARKRRRKELGIDEGFVMELGTRTSTNAGAVGIIAVIVMRVIETVTPEVATITILGMGMQELILVALTWVVARFSKTPAAPGKI